MSYLLSISDPDIFANTERKILTPLRIRNTVKIIIFNDENKIALVGTKYLLLPGGGVDPGESLQQACERECMEEIGCKIKIEEQLCITEEFRYKDQRKQITNFFTAKIIGSIGKPQTIQKDEIGMRIEWYSLEDAIGILSEQMKIVTFEHYNTCFNVRTHLTALKCLKSKIV